MPVDLTTKTRTAIACENCRVRRRKCDGNRPCSNCRTNGTQGSCFSRSKARPQRTRNNGPINEHSGVLRKIEKDVGEWLASTGLGVHLVLPEIPRLRVSTAVEVINEDESFEQYLRSTPYGLQFSSPEKARDLYKQYKAGQFMMLPDDRAYILSCICLGYCFSSANSQLGSAIWYWEGSKKTMTDHPCTSTSTLCALLNLQLFAQMVGGPDDNSDLFELLSNQGRTMPPATDPMIASEGGFVHVKVLQSCAFYRDSWYATLADRRPYLSVTDNPEAFDCSGWTEAESLFSTLMPLSLYRLAQLENEILHQLHSDHIDTSNKDYILETEVKLAATLKLQGGTNAELSAILFDGYAVSRYHWVRLLLRAPLMAHPLLGPSSISVVARGVSVILHSYRRLLDLDVLHACWPQLRRITTCGQLLLQVYRIYHEFTDDEAQTLLDVLLQLVSYHENTFPFAKELALGFRAAFHHIGIDSPTKPAEQSLQTVALAENCVFDFSLPSSWTNGTEQEQWWPPLF